MFISNMQNGVSDFYFDNKGYPRSLDSMNLFFPLPVDHCFS